MARLWSKAATTRAAAARSPTAASEARNVLMVVVRATTSATRCRYLPPGVMVEKTKCIMGEKQNV